VLQYWLTVSYDLNMTLTMGKFEDWERNNTFMNRYTISHLSRFPHANIQPGMQWCQRRSYRATPTTCSFVSIINHFAHHCFGSIQIQLQVLKCCDHIYVIICNYLCNRPCPSSGGQSPTSHHGGPGSSPGQVMWDLWWTKWHWGRFSLSTSVPLANSHSTDYSTFIIIYHSGLVQ
jgi:hypothetical protein